jgi:VIT1/CCC1 family predicted Fe2+/Mn2+ transporter
MAVGNFLAIRANESARAVEDLPEEEAHPEKHAVATMIAFVVAGAVPLASYVFPELWPGRFAWACALTFVTLFAVGAVRGWITLDRWWAAGAEMLGLGLFVAAAAYAAGYLVAAIVN